MSGSLARVLTEMARPETSEPDMIEADSLPFDGFLFRMMPLRLADREARFGGFSPRPSVPESLAAPTLDLRRGAASESSSDDVLGLRCDVVLAARLRVVGVRPPEAPPLTLPARDRPLRGVVSPACSVSASESSSLLTTAAPAAPAATAAPAAAFFERELRFDLADLPLLAELVLFRRLLLGRRVSSVASESLVAAAALDLDLLLVDDADDLGLSRVEPLVWLTTFE